VDNVSKSIRSRTMSRIKSSSNLSTEKAVGKLLRAAGLVGYRKQWPIRGKPDFAWPGRKIAVFVDGCFWHGCARCCRIPNTNKEYWVSKIERNRARDKETTKFLRSLGWYVVRIPECKISKGKFVDDIARFHSLRAA
jgi:DNA mismatch endonuclease (patch repair protein)